MGQTSTARVHAFRARERRDEVLLTITVNRAALLDTLEAMHIAVGDDDLARGVETLLERLQAKL